MVNDQQELKMESKAEKWVMHIIGPDDVIEQPDELTALRKANEFNKELIRFAPERHQHDPVILAVAKNAMVDEV